VTKQAGPLVAAGLFVLAASAHAQVSQSAKGYLFRMKFSKGKTIKYASQVSTSTGKSVFSVLFPITLTAASVRGDVSDLIVRSGPMSINKKQLGSVTTYRMQVNSRGKVVGGQGATSAGITEFPANPVKPGASWDASINVAGTSMGGGASRVTAHYRFQKVTSYKGKPVAQLGVKVFATGSTRISGDGVSFVSMTDGGVVHSALKLQVSISSGSEPVATDVKVDRS
jgi:hypothetical protein